MTISRSAFYRDVDRRLSEFGHALVELPATAYSYEVVMTDRASGIVSGQTPRRDGEVVHRGRMLAEDPAERARPAAELCAVNALSAIEQHVGLNRLASLSKVTVYVNSAPDFVRQSQVGEFASKIFRVALEERGRHARTAIGVAALPEGSLVELDCAFTLDLEVDR